MDSLLTHNELGYCKGEGDDFVIASETGAAVLYLTLPQQSRLVTALIAENDDLIPVWSIDLVLDFNQPDFVRLTWKDSIKESQVATFKTIELIQFIDPESVRLLVLRRKADYL